MRMQRKGRSLGNDKKFAKNGSFFRRGRAGNRIARAEPRLGEGAGTAPRAGAQAEPRAAPGRAAGAERNTGQNREERKPGRAARDREGQWRPPGARPDAG